MPPNTATQMHQLAAGLRREIDAANTNVQAARRHLAEVEDTVRTRTETKACIYAAIDARAEDFRGSCDSDLRLAMRHLPDLTGVSTHSPLFTVGLRQRNMDPLWSENKKSVHPAALYWILGDQIKAAYAAAIDAMDWPPAMAEAERREAIDTARRELRAAEAARDALIDDARAAGINII